MNTTHGMTTTNRNTGLYPVHSGSVQGTVAAKERMKSVWGDPLFLADWAEPVFLHFEIDPDELQPYVPFPLDTRNGKAFVTLVAFTMRHMRFRIGGKLTRWLTEPIATHSFLNLRTYVKYNNEPGIYFINEWLNNKIATKLGPGTFGLPYRHGNIDYKHNYRDHHFSGRVSSDEKAISYTSTADPECDWAPCESGTIGEFLLERYTAFTARWKLRGLFRIWHDPWPQKRLSDVEITDLSLLEDAPGGTQWAKHLRFIGGNVSTGANDVWMGRPHLI